MKFKSRKIVALVLTFVMLFSSVQMSYASPADYANLILKFDSFFGASVKATNATNLYTVLHALEGDVLEDAVRASLDADPTLKQNLKDAGFDTTAITYLIEEMRLSFPNTLGEMQSDTPVDIFAKMYKNFDGLKVSLIKSDIEEVMNFVYDQAFPAGFKTELTDNYSASARVLSKDLLTTVMNQKIGSVVYDTYTGNYSVNLHPEATALAAIKAELNGNLKSGVTAETSDDFAQDYYDLSVIILEAIEDIAKTNQATENALGDMLLAFELVTKSTIDTAPSTGGGSTGGGTPPADDSNLTDEEQDAVDEIIAALPDGDATEEDKEAVQEATVDLIDSVFDSVGESDNPEEQIAELGETVGQVIGALDGEEAAEVAAEFADLLGEAIDNADMTPEEQKDMVKEVIGTTFSELVDNEDVKQSDIQHIKKDLKDLVKKVVENAGKIELIADSMPQAGQGAEKEVQEFELTADILASVIEAVVETTEELSETLADNDLGDVLKGFEKNINIELPEVADTDEVSVGLSADAVAKLGENNIGIKVEAEGISFKLPASLLKTAEEEVTITSKPVAADVELSDKTKGGKTKELKTMDLTVAVGDKPVAGEVELSFSLEDLEGIDVDTIMVGVFEDGVWTKLDYEIIDGYVVFTAPHFSIYSLMTYEASFADIKTNWAKGYITSLAAKGIVSGRSDLAFDPQNTITRAEFVTLLVNHLGLDDAVFSNYKDVNEGTWYYDIVARAGMNSITAGTVNGNFRPEEAITREEMAVMIAKAYKAKYGYAMTGEAVSFADEAEMSEYALEAIAAAKANGIISGYSDNTFRPLATATRAEAATMMYLFLEK